MGSYAQTNIQLFNQLRRDGYEHAELDCIHNTYELAMRLFTGLFRPSGKTFIDHLVGTASILGSLRVPVEAVAAGLIHTAYAHGDFGGGLRCDLEAKRQEVRRAVGQKVEEYVAGYAALRWNTQNLPAIRDGIEALDQINRYVLLMHLANETEECLDLGILYCGNGEGRQQWVTRTGPVMVEMAEMLGFPALAAELAQVLKETAATEIPTELRSRSGHDRPFVIAPGSYRLRLSVAVRHQFERGRNRFACGRDCLFKGLERRCGALLHELWG